MHVSGSISFLSRPTGLVFPSKALRVFSLSDFADRRRDKTVGVGWWELSASTDKKDAFGSIQELLEISRYATDSIEG